MKKITFKYKDAYTPSGQWSEQSCIMESIEECIEMYGLEESGVSYKIISVEPVKE